MHKRIEVARKKMIASAMPYSKYLIIAIGIKTSHVENGNIPAKKDDAAMAIGLGTPKKAIDDYGSKASSFCSVCRIKYYQYA